jgi:ABC-2 type transport system permease protein
MATQPHLNNKYIASIAISVRQQLSNRGQLMGRVFLYLVIVYLFFQVFQSVNAPPNRAWYLAITEWIILSTPSIAFQVAQDIRSGQIVYFILRPMHYLSFRFFECIGVFLVRFVLIGVCCLSLGYFLTGQFPGNISIWLNGVLFIVMAVLLYTLIAILIGLLSFWLKEIQPLYYLNFTSMASFGGLIVPLDFYSETLKNISFCTPYPWILWWPAEWITATEIRETINLPLALFSWGFWMLFFTSLILIVYRKCFNSFAAEGG